MQIDFELEGRPVQYFRDPMFGKSELRTPDGPVVLDSPYDLGTHFSLQLTKTVTCEAYGHTVTVEKTRPLFLAGFRAAKYKIFIDGVLAIEQSGF